MAELADAWAAHTRIPPERRDLGGISGILLCRVCRTRHPLCSDSHASRVLTSQQTQQSASSSDGSHRCDSQWWSSLACGLSLVRLISSRPRDLHADAADMDLDGGVTKL